MQKRADALIEEIMEDVNNNGGELIGSLYSSGAASFAATLNHLSNNGFINFDVQEQFEELNQHLFEDALEFIKVDNLVFFTWVNWYSLLFYAIRTYRFGN